MVRTVPVADPGDLIAPASRARLAGLDPPAARASQAGVRWPASRVPARQDRFTAADKWLRALLDGALVEDLVGAPGCGPVAFGSFTFDPTSEGSVLILPQVVLGRRAGQAWLTTITGQPPAQPGPTPRSRLGQSGLGQRARSGRWPRPGGPRRRWRGRPVPA